jgi:amino acid transporter
MTGKDYEILFTVAVFILAGLGMVLTDDSITKKKLLKRKWYIFFLIVGGYLTLYCIYRLDFVFYAADLVWEDWENASSISNPLKLLFFIGWPLLGIFVGSVCAYLSYLGVRYHDQIPRNQL